MKYKGLIIFFTLTLIVGCKKKDNEYGWVKNAITTADFQMKMMVSLVDSMRADTAAFPRSVRNDSLQIVGAVDWTSGFFPGSLWLTYELAGDSFLKKEARKYTNMLRDIQYQKGTHDLGFMMYCSYGNAFRLAPEYGDDTILINSSKTLIERFSPVTGTIRSWDFGKWSYPVIIDNMMNLDMLFWASKYTKDSMYRHVSVSHANVTMKNHFRNDNSSYHVVSYKPESGVVESKGTSQGCSDSSSWARGQAWGLYGYTLCYRETKDAKYLEHAEKIAAYIISSVKTDDLIPYWDYKAPKIPNEPRDASAAAVTASALIELSQLVKNGDIYLGYAEKILMSLSGEKYLSAKGSNHGFILKHSVGDVPENSEIDTPINYTDYYYLESLGRYIKIKKLDIRKL